VAGCKALDDQLQATEKRVQELEAKLDEDGRETSNLDELQRSLREKLEDERKQHQKDLEERDFTTDQTRKKYQGMAPHVSIFRIPKNYYIQRNWHSSAKVCILH
jgi:myosin heavy chain 9/10/11/14